MEQCLKCNGQIIGVEYHGLDPYHYDGISEWECAKCGSRWGRWSGRELAEGEKEPPRGRGEE